MGILQQFRWAGFFWGKHALKEQSRIQKLCWIQKLGFRNSLRGIQKLSRQIQKLFRRNQKLLQERWKTPDQLNVLPAAPACTAEWLSPQQLYREESCSLCQFHSVARVIVSWQVWTLIHFFAFAESLWMGLWVAWIMLGVWLDPCHVAMSILKLFQEGWKSCQQWQDSMAPFNASQNLMAPSSTSGSEILREVWFNGTFKWTSGKKLWGIQRRSFWIQRNTFWILACLSVTLAYWTDRLKLTFFPGWNLDWCWIQSVLSVIVMLGLNFRIAFFCSDKLHRVCESDASTLSSCWRFLTWLWTGQVNHSMRDWKHIVQVKQSSQCK